MSCMIFPNSISFAIDLLIHLLLLPFAIHMYKIAITDKFY
jgi:hypothetical protein